MNSGSTDVPTGGERIEWIDTAKTIGIGLVYLGHCLQQFLFTNAQAHDAFKLIYSFHMPFFFVLSGFVSSEKQVPFSSYAARKLLTRIAPMIFFNLIALLFHLSCGLLHGTFWAGGYARGLLNVLVAGRPQFNDVTWFFVCLFTVEMIHFFVKALLRKPFPTIACMLTFYLAGWMITRHMDFVVAVTGIGANVWYIHEAVVAYSFYILGILLRRAGWFDGAAGSRDIAGALAGLALVLATFRLNTGPFDTGRYDVVMMAGSSHGSIFWFPVTACAGTLMVLFASRLMRPSKDVLAFGRNSFWLLGIAGIFHTFVNPGILKSLPASATAYPAALFAASLLLTGLELLVSAPIAAFLDRHLGVLRGRAPIPAISPGTFS